MVVGIQEQKTSESRDHHFIASAHKVHFFHKYAIMLVILLACWMGEEWRFIALIFYTL